MELSNRKLKLLYLIVNSYIQTGEPVSSKTLCDILNSSISSATIRNEMAELTELHFLEQPHTSAGRIPSHFGYRLYINKLMNKKMLSKENQKLIDDTLSMYKDNPDNLIHAASNLLSQITNSTVVSVAMSTDKNVIKQIEIVKLGTCKVMIILVTSSGVIKSRILRLNFIIDDDTLSLIVNVLNKKLVNVFLSDLTPAFIQTFAASLGELTFLLSDILEAVIQLVKEANYKDVHLDGQANLLLIPEFKPELVIQLIESLKNEQVLKDLFFDTSFQKTRVIIGKENKHSAFNKSSVILTKYNAKDQKRGIIGIIGPTRMNYSYLIANVEYVASSVGNLLYDLLRLD